MLVLLGGSSIGCVRLASGVIAFAPNCGRSIEERDDLSASSLQALGVDAQLRVEVGPPAASLQLWLLEPGHPHGEKSTPRGTVLMLHGIRRTKRDMLGLGKALAGAGYRCVLIDLRGHGLASAMSD